MALDDNVGPQNLHPTEECPERCRDVEQIAGICIVQISDNGRIKYELQAVCHHGFGANFPFGVMRGDICDAKLERGRLLDRYFGDGWQALHGDYVAEAGFRQKWLKGPAPKPSTPAGQTRDSYSVRA